jgi:hypothetical protein
MEKLWKNFVIENVPGHKMLIVSRLSADTFLCPSTLVK